MPFDSNRIAPPLLPRPSPAFLPGILRDLPLWALTSQQHELRLSLAGLLLNQPGSHPDFTAAAQGMLAQAFQDDPFDAAAVSMLLQAQTAHPFLPPKAVAMASLIAAAPTPGQEDVGIEEIRAAGDVDLIVQYLEVASRDARHALSRLAAAYPVLCRLPDTETARRLLTAFAPHVPPPLFSRLEAEFACLRLSPETALDHVLRLDQDIWGLFVAIAASSCLERLGDRQDAFAACLVAQKALPHHVNLLLRAHVLAQPRPVPSPPAPGEAAVCLYSLNKADLFRQCLTHLAGTELGASVVAVLDNGSTDGTAAMLREVAGLFPNGQFVQVRLPVNIGAPGARNWLLSLPEVKACRHAAFLDDDAFPPADWLGRLLQTARDNPTAGAIGCSITDMDAPRDHQSADFNLFPPNMGTPGLPGVTERLFVCESCRGAADFGLFAYIRPCLSVSGCCHLLSRQALETAGSFDIRFNPTQFDDLERDIRSFLAGYPCVYDGTVRVAHQQGSSLAKAQTQAQVAHIMGNKIKLEYAVSDVEADRLWRDNLALLGRDLLAKAEALGDL